MSLTKLVIILAACASLLIAYAAPAAAFNLFGSTCKNNPSAPTCQQAAKQSQTGENPVIHIINVAANIIAAVTAVIAVIMIIISGVTMAASGGSSETVASSRRRIIFALVGIIVVALAWVIVRFITDTLLK